MFACSVGVVGGALGLPPAAAVGLAALCQLRQMLLSSSSVPHGTEGRLHVEGSGTYQLPAGDQLLAPASAGACMTAGAALARPAPGTD
jgi:hypothetical protein